jgi:uncharacterized protein YciI
MRYSGAQHHNGSDLGQGTVKVVRAELSSRASAEATLADGPYAWADLYDRIEVHSWQFGGRPQD